MFGYQTMWLTYYLGKIFVLSPILGNSLIKAAATPQVFSYEVGYLMLMTAMETKISW